MNYLPSLKEWDLSKRLNGLRDLWRPLQAFNRDIAFAVLLIHRIRVNPQFAHPSRQLCGFSLRLGSPLCSCE